MAVVSGRSSATEVQRLAARGYDDFRPTHEFAMRAIIAGISGVVYQYLRNGRAAELPGLGHNAHVEDPAAVLRLARPYLTE